MRKKSVSGSCKMLRNSFTSMILMPVIVTATGCADIEDPPETTGGNDQIIVNEMMPLDAMQIVRVERTRKGDGLQIVSPGWKETSPGVWESDTAGKIEIDATQAATTDRVTPLVATCIIGIYNGSIGNAPTGLGLTGIGAVGFAQASCPNDIVFFTVTAQVCTDLGCGMASFRIETGPPGTPGPDGYGTFKQGTLGASCSSTASITGGPLTPRVVTQSAVFPCG